MYIVLYFVKKKTYSVTTFQLFSYTQAIKPVLRAQTDMWIDFFF